MAPSGSGVGSVSVDRPVLSVHGLVVGRDGDAAGDAEAVGVVPAVPVGGRRGRVDHAICLVVEAHRGLLKLA